MTEQEEELSRPTDMIGDASVVVCSSRHAVTTVRVGSHKHDRTS